MACPLTMLAVSALLALVIAAGAGLYVRRALTPLRDLRSALAKAGAGRPAVTAPGGEVGAIVARVHELAETLAEREAQLRAARAETEHSRRFLAHISHELRTPLHAVLGYAELIRQTAELDETVRERAVIIHRSGAHLLQLIDDLLDIAAIQAGRIKPAPVEVALDGLLADLGATAGRAATARGLDFRVDAAPDLPTWVFVDGRRLRQILLNLLDNAVKYTEQGGVVLRCRLSATGAQTPRLCCEVEDSGPGIDPAIAERLFQPFEQGRANQPGSGLGLAISRQLANVLGGALTLSGRAGGGSCFRLEVPVGLCSAAGDGDDDRGQPRICGYRGPRRRLLVVDDSATHRLLLEHLLSELGFRVDLAKGAAAALARAAIAAPDLVVMDLVMPDTCGYAATVQLRTALGRPALPVIALSASPIGSLEDARDLGFEACLLKPVDFDQLLAAIGACLGLEWLRQPADCAGHSPEDPAHCRPRAASQTADDGLEAPPTSELETIAELVRAEDWQSAADWCDDLAAGQPELAPFADQVRSLVATCDRAALLGWLERLL